MLAPVQVVVVLWVGVVGAGVALSVGRRVGLAEVGEEEASVAMLVVFVVQEVEWVAVADHSFSVGWSVVVLVVVVSEGEVVACVADVSVGAGDAVVIVVWIGWLSFACDSPW